VYPSRTSPAQQHLADGHAVFGVSSSSGTGTFDGLCDWECEQDDCNWVLLLSPESRSGSSPGVECKLKDGQTAKTVKNDFYTACIDLDWEEVTINEKTYEFKNGRAFVINAERTVQQIAVPVDVFLRVRAQTGTAASLNSDLPMSLVKALREVSPVIKEFTKDVRFRGPE